MPEHVLITGGAGFIGSRLAARFAGAGHRVTVLDLLLPQVHGDDPDVTSPLLRATEQVATVIRGSVTSAHDLARSLEGVTVVVHLAAETGTGQSMYEISRYSQTNVGGTANLLEQLAHRSHSVRRLIVASTRAVYGEGAYRAEDGTLVYPPARAAASLAAGDFEVHAPGYGSLMVVPTSEDAVLKPSSVYGITKHAQESLVMTVAPTIGIEPLALRYQNVYGPGQSLKNPYTGILSIFSSLIRQGKEINVFEDGRESRDFVYVDDVVEATYRAAVVPEAAGQILNVGSGVGTTVLEVVAALMEAYGVDVPVRISGNFRVGDIRHNIADTDRLCRVLGYVPTVAFRDGVRSFAHWVLTQPVGADAYQRSLDELAAHKLLG